MDAPYFTRGDKVCDILFHGDDANRAADRTRVDRPIEVFEGKLSTDYEFLTLKDRVSMAASKEPALAESVDEFGRCHSTGVRSNFYGIRHVNGYPMEHGTWPLASNLLKRDQAGLSNKWLEPWHKYVFHALTQLFFEDISAVPMTIRKGSSTVIPFFTRKPADRNAYAVLALNTAQAAGELMLQGNFKEAYLAHQFGGAYYVVYRSQSSDKVSFVKGEWTAKPRQVADFNYAISGGERGQMFTSSKSLEHAGFRVPQGFFRERLRTAMGGPFQLNAALMPIMQAARANIYDRFAFSFHHTTRKQKEEKVHGWDLAIAADVSDHDTFWPAHLYLPVIMDELRNMGFAEWWVALLDASFKLPIYVGAPAVGEGQTLIGDWRDPQMNVGMPSGHSGTDLFGTLGMSGQYFITQVTETAPELIAQFKDVQSVKRVLVEYLQGKLAFAQMSKTDDAFLLWKKSPSMAKAITLRERLKAEEAVNPYIKLSYEHGGAFLGDILLYDVTRELKRSIFIGNILSDAINTLSPEYGVQSQTKDRSKTKRPYPGIAWGSHREVYGSAPGYEALGDIMERNWRDVYHESYVAFREELYRKDVALLARDMASVDKYNGLDHLSTADKEVLVSPDKLHYKYDPASIDPEVRALTLYQLPVELIAPYVASITGAR